MFDVLKNAETALPDLLSDEAGWTGLYAPTERPILHRLWRQWGEHRLYLHRFDPCAEAEAFWHPHPWAFALRILAGTYEMKVGASADPLVVPPNVATTVLVPGSAYAMQHPDGFHAIRPVGGAPAYTFMVAGAVVWPQNKARQNAPTRPLTPGVRADLFAFFCARYPGR